MLQVTLGSFQDVGRKRLYHCCYNSNFSLSPFDLIIREFEEEDEQNSGSSAASATSLLKGFKLPRLLRLLKIMRLMRLVKLAKIRPEIIWWCMCAWCVCVLVI